MTNQFNMTCLHESPAVIAGTFFRGEVNDFRSEHHLSKCWRLIIKPSRRVRILCLIQSGPVAGRVSNSTLISLRFKVDAKQVGTY